VTRPVVVTVAVAALLAATALLSACRAYLPSNSFLHKRAATVSKSTADARHRFDHAVHAKVLAAQGQTCADCHRFDVKIETGEEPLAKDISARALHPGGAACHYCHGPDDTKMATAPGACTTCHTNLEPLRPLNHDVAWTRVHASVAEAEPGSCNNCHKQSECIYCHETRDTIQTIVHDRNFLFYHSIEARANPMQCGSCHRADYCIRCHQQGKVEVRQ
jgi:hypothetical protein